MSTRVTFPLRPICKEKKKKKKNEKEKKKNPAGSCFDAQKSVGVVKGLSAAEQTSATLSENISGRTQDVMYALL